MNYGQRKVNQLGGRYVNGRPLPIEMRRSIVNFALQGVKPCDISRQLKVSHGCVSKILQKYKTTGSIEPGSVNSSAKAFLTDDRREIIKNFIQTNPEMSPPSIRLALLQNEQIGPKEVPSSASIARLIKESSNGHRSDCSLQEPKNGSKRRIRTTFTESQINVLETAFQYEIYPDSSERQRLAEQLGLSETRIQIWFSNRRAKRRKFNPATNGVLNGHQTQSSSAFIPQHNPGVINYNQEHIYNTVDQSWHHSSEYEMYNHQQYFNQPFYQYASTTDGYGPISTYPMQAESGKVEQNRKRPTDFYTISNAKVARYDQNNYSTVLPVEYEMPNPHGGFQTASDSYGNYVITEGNQTTIYNSSNNANNDTELQ
ncbi:hypothetical protein ACOME3_003432 [Neoechinorhynchus agilis]